jgi:hypothetical protein
MSLEADRDWGWGRLYCLGDRVSVWRRIEGTDRWVGWEGGVGGSMDGFVGQGEGGIGWTEEEMFGWLGRLWGVADPVGRGDVGCLVMVRDCGGEWEGPYELLLVDSRLEDGPYLVLVCGQASACPDARHLTDVERSVQF